MENYKEGIVSALKSVKGGDFQERHDLVYGGFLDSFELIMLIEELERRFQIHIPLEHISPEEFDNIDSIYEIIESALRD